MSTRAQVAALEEEPNWDDLDWIRPGVRGFVVFYRIRRFAFRTSDSTVLYWMKRGWHWANPHTAKTFEQGEPYPIE